MNKYQEAFETINCDGSTFIERTRKFKEKYQESPVYLIKELVDKETPKKVKIKEFDNGEYGAYCPSCNSGLSFHWKMEYCPSCGQKLDWSEENDR